MKRRLSAALVVWLGLWLWPADRASAADSMYGGGVSSSGSQPWIGGHNNMPRQTLSPVGTVFTPPTSFGNFWILNNAAGQSVACPPDIADGDSMIVHFQYGAGAPYSPAISFSAPCYGWPNVTQPQWSESPTQSDSAFCQSMNPPDVTGASFVCAAQLNVAGSPPTAWDLVHKNANITISGAGNLIATASGASADKAGYANNFHSTGKFSFAVTATSVASSIGLGIGNASATTTSFCGNDGNSICYYASGSVVTNNGVGGGNTSGLPTFATGNKIWIAVHFTGTQTNFWVNKSATAPGTSGWVGNGGTSGNPDTDTNPIVFNSTAAVSPAYDLSVSGDKVTADFLTPSGLATYSTW